MARQNRSKATETETAEVEAPTTEAQEAPVSENTSTETVEAPVAVDLTAFKDAVTVALGEADKTTGEVAALAIAPVNEEYRKLEGIKAKSEARDFLEAQMLEAVGNLDAVSARGLNDLRANLKAGSAPKAPKAPTDPTEAFVERVAAINLAQALIYKSVPEGVAEDWAAKVGDRVNELTESADSLVAYNASTAEDKGDAPEVSPIVRQAVKLASGKVSGRSGGNGGGAGGPRRDIGKHIASAFDSMNPGEFLTVAEICKHQSTEYGEVSPSPGAVSARLFPTSGKLTIEGIEAVNKGEIDGKNPKGARKAH